VKGNGHALSEAAISVSVWSDLGNSQNMESGF
jgi:hypothetical protein